MKIGLTLLGGFELSIGNDKPQTTPTETVSKELSVQQPTKLIGYDNHGESMYNRLQRLCHPKNFVEENYDKNKLDIANMIYTGLLSINPSDIPSVMDLVIRAEEGLHINLLDEYQYFTLKYILNPKNYMDPYDAPSITLSNELYSQLMQPDLNFTKYAQIVCDAEPLLKITEEKQREAEKNKIAEVEGRDWMLYYSY